MFETFPYSEAVNREPLSVKMVANISTPPPRLSHLIQFLKFQMRRTFESSCLPVSAETEETRLSAAVAGDRRP